MITTTCVVLLVVSVVIYCIPNLLKALKIRKYVVLLPGPRLYFLIDHLPHVSCDNVILFKRLRKWARDYYPIYGLYAGLTTTVNVSSAEDFELVASGIKNIKKGPTYNFLELWLGDGLLTSTGSKWQSRRKILTPAFHFRILQGFIKIFNNATDNLVDTLKKECNKTIDIVPYISRLTLSSIAETSMGTKLNLEKEEDREYYSAIYQVGEIYVYRTMKPWFYSNAVFYNFSLKSIKERKLVKTLQKFTNNIIEQKSKEYEPCHETDNEFSSTKRVMPMLELLLNAKGDNAIDEKGIQDEVNTFMFEGHDTVSTAICFTLMMLATHKDVQDLILQEINQVLGDSDTQPTYNDLQELKYMERCIKESMRLFPSVPFISRILEEDIISTNGYTIPKGAVVNIHIFDIHRDPKIWPDPEKFDPDRFLLENSKDRHPFAYVPFSAGPRNCIGQRYAILELKAVICGILRNFVLEPVDTPENIMLMIDMILRPETGMIRIKFIPRR